MKEVFEVN